MPAGRPSKIDAVVGHREEDGQPITVAERIVNGIAIGLYLEPAIAAAGVAKDTAYGWLHTAGLVRIRTAGDDHDKSISDHEQKCIEFSDAVVTTTAQWEAGKLAVLERLERGGIEQITVTEKVAIIGGEEVVVERTTKTEHTLPDAATIRWRLTRRCPDRYAQKMELVGPDGGPVVLTVEDRANALADSLEAHLETTAANGNGNGRRKRARRNGSNGSG